MHARAEPRPPSIVPEHRLLVRLCRRDRPARDEVDRALEAISFPTLLGVASRHGVSGVAVGRLAGTVDGRPDLADAERRLRRRGALMRELESAALAAVRARGIEPVVAKGSALARFYERPHERGATDLDLLVEPTAVDAAVEALETLGYRGPSRGTVRDAYRRSHFHLPMRRRDGHVVEVHWGLARRESPFGLDPARLLREAAPDPLDPAGPRYPSVEHLVLVVVLQHLQEGFARLSRAVDLDRLLARSPGLDWDALARAAHDGGLRGSLAVALRLCRILLDTPVPERFEAAIRPSWLRRAHLEMERPVETLLSQRLDLTWATRLVFEFWLADGLPDGWRRLRSEWSLDVESEALFGRGVGAATLASRVPKIPARQFATYAVRLRDALAGHRPQIRFWSSHASSSDFL